MKRDLVERDYLCKVSNAYGESLDHHLTISCPVEFKHSIAWMALSGGTTNKLNFEHEPIVNFDKTS